MHHSHGGLSGIYAVTLPPLSTLPSWSRSSLHHKQKLPLQPDKLRPLASSNTKFSRSNDNCSSDSNSPVSEKEENVLHVLEIYKQKVKYLTNNIDFLKDEHAKILKSLHDEIERLKYENKELKFKLIISDSNSGSWIHEKALKEKKESKSAVSSSPSRRTSNKAYEDEIYNLRESLSNEKNRNRMLQDQIDELTLSEPKHYDDDVDDEIPASIEECYNLINNLKTENEAQQKEISYLQSKMNYQHENKKLAEPENVATSLPALRPALQSKVVHRMKRQQILTKEKNRSDILKEL